MESKVTLENIEKAMAESIYELETDSRLVRTGLKKNQESEKILIKYNWLFSLDTLNFVKNLLLGETKSDLSAQLKIIYFDLAEGYLYRQLAKEDDEISNYYSNAVGTIEGEKIPFFDLRSELSKTEDFDKREVLDELQLQIIAREDGAELAVLEKEIALIKRDFGHSYLSFYEEKKGIDYAKFYSLVKEIHAGLKDLFEEKMPDWVSKKLGRKFGTIPSCHMAYALQLPEYLQYFPQEKLISAFSRTLETLGFDLEKEKNIHIDIADRPRKNPRAVCYAPTIPEEIHLIIKAVGGYYDYESFFHEGGHSLHYAHVSKDLPFAYRQLSPSYALTELFSYLFEDLIRNPFWLEEYLGLSPDVVKSVAFDSHMIYLYMLMRYLGKFTYEYETFTADDLRSAPSRYTEKQNEFTGFLYDKRNYLYDMDSGFYSADYLRAWIGEAQLSGFLAEKFGPKWFANSEAGNLLTGMWKTGSKFDLEEMLLEETKTQPFELAPLFRKFKRYLE